MRFLTIFKWAALLIVALLVAVLAIVFFIDIDNYRGEIEAEFKKATGRELSINGEIDLAISLSPVVVVEDISIANSDWGSRPQMMTLQRVEAQVKLLPLLSSEFEVTELRLIRPDILLETNAEGVANWEFGPLADLAALTDGSVVGEGAQPGEPVSNDRQIARIPFFQRIEIRQGRLAYRNLQTGKETRLELAEVVARGQAPGEPINISAEGKWNQEPFKMAGSIESLESLRAGPRVRLDIEVDAFGVRAKVAGGAAESLKPERLNLKVQADGENLAALSGVAGFGLPEMGPIRLNATIQGSTEEFLADNVNIMIGSSEFLGKFAVSRKGPRPRITGTLASTKFDLTEFQRKLTVDGRQELASGSTTGDSSAGEASHRVFADDPLNLDGLQSADVDLSIRVHELVTSSLRLHRLETGLKLHDGLLKVMPFTATLAGSNVEGGFLFDANGAPPLLAVAIRAPGIDLGALLREADVTDLYEGKAEFRASLQGEGESVAAIMAGLAGEVRLLGGPGRLKTRALDAIAGGAWAALATLFSGKEEWTVINCGASYVEVKDGLATSSITLMDTAFSTLAARGGINLATEALDLTIEPSPKSLTLSVAVPVHVKGTLSEPFVQLDTGQTVKRIGGLLGLFVFPPAAIVGLGELGSEKNECVKIASSGQSYDREAAQDASSAPRPRPDRNAKQAIEGLVEGIAGGLQNILENEGN